MSIDIILKLFCKYTFLSLSIFSFLVKADHIAVIAFSRGKANNVFAKKVDAVAFLNAEKCDKFTFFGIYR